MNLAIKIEILILLSKLMEIYLEEKKTPTLENDRSHDKKSRGILGLLFFVFASRTCFSNHRVLHLPRGSELKSGQGRFSADAASATA